MRARPRLTKSELLALRPPTTQPSGFPCLAFLAISLTCCSLALVIPQAQNNWKLRTFAGNLFAYPLPPQTEVVSRYSEVELKGNSNHCDFEARQTMVTPLSEQEIEAYYVEVALPPAGNYNAGRAPAYRTAPALVFVRFDETGMPDGRRRFTLVLYDHGHPPGLDIRCH